MAASLIQHGAIRTTEAKAKELRRFVEKIITIAKKGTLHARRRVIAKLGDRAMTDADGSFLEKTVVQKLFDEIAPGYADRPGGYTRMVRLDERRIGDAGSQVVLQLVGQVGEQAPGAGGTSRRKKRAAKRHEAAAVAEAEAQEAEETEAESEQAEADQTNRAEQESHQPEQQDDQPGQDRRKDQDEKAGKKKKRKK